MASVTFDVAVGGDGLTINDGSQPTPGGLGNGGHRTLFVPALNNVVAIAKNVVDKVDPISDIFLPPSATNPTLRPDGTPVTSGQVYFNTVAQENRQLKNGVWAPYIVDQPTGAGGDAVFYLNDNIVRNNYTIPPGKNAMSAGPLAIQSGVVITVPPGQGWAIV